MKSKNKLEEFWKHSSGISKKISTSSFIQEAIKIIVSKYDCADPFYISEQLNIEIQWKNFGKHPLGQTVYYNNSPYIFLNEDIRDTPQCFFTCAHELGHIILQPEITGYQTGRLSHGVCEYQANQFATGLMGLLYVEDNGYGPESYYDLVHQYGSPVDMLD
ncbi:ImmA/IrrE family metallo-endopeptidase [Lentilactobacillus parabuchneri]|uniref:ImmA/IrrE family metallo-endopeptidase n=1 Tax=Lentilactobacillus parabuchneri TaxID=152331 RepID=UPI0015C4E5A6|nr:ImmA/IrrE family metallo-endopeptidase [Lentilactobacillus parabuchneri]